MCIRDRLRTIMISKPSTGSTDAARQRGLEILGKLKEGVSFADLASIYSEDTFRAQGGDRGWVELEREHYQPALEQAIRALKPGQHSDLIETENAFWILLVEDARSSHIRPLPEVRSEIEQTLIGQERARLEKAWIDRLKSKAFIRYF
ncbi:MAG: peptidylprolyl isomerase, partial [Verrucomicrobiae bacterium]|nr:peptidylprolyl isomerase [Verrucomicrobiae bacterium]